MKNFIRVTTFLLVVMVTQLPTAWARPISLDVQLSRNSILPLSRLGVLVELKNSTDAPLKLKSGFYAGFQLQEQGQTKSLWYWLQDGLVTTQEETLAPGQSVRILYWMSVGAMQSLEPSPKKYTLTARFDEFESAPQSFEVKPFTGTELEAARYLQTNGLFVYFQEFVLDVPLNKLLTGQVEEKFEKFITNYPNSSYLPAAKLALLNVKLAINYHEQKIQQWLHSGTESQEAIDFISSGLRRAYGEAAFQRVTTKDYAQALLAINREAENLAPTLPAPFNARGWMVAQNIARLRGDKSAMLFYSDKALEAIRTMTYAN